MFVRVQGAALHQDRHRVLSQESALTAPPRPHTTSFPHARLPDAVLGTSVCQDLTAFEPTISPTNSADEPKIWLYPRLPIRISGSKYMIFLPNKCRSGVIEGVPYAVFPVVHRPRPADGAPHCMPGAPSGRASAVSACGPTGETCFDRTLRNRRGAHGLGIPQIHAFSSLGDPHIAC